MEEEVSDKNWYALGATVVIICAINFMHAKIALDHKERMLELDMEMREHVETRGTTFSEKRLMYAYVTYYCATGDGCDHPICGGNEKTANGRNARVGDGCAVDPRHIPYGSVVRSRTDGSIV
jgi:3D (Asp-Asp-Asp) domain-containing protein